MSKIVKAKYANGFSVSVNQAEMRILYTLSTPIIKDGIDTKEAKIEDVADIRIGLSLMKQMHQILGESIKNYETNYGEIIIKDIVVKN